jgi:hypothetical protein
MFVGAFGLNQSPPVVDLCGVIDSLVDSHYDNRSGRELLITLANKNNLDHITKYIRAKLNDDQARKVYGYLQRHPERIL